MYDVIFVGHSVSGMTGMLAVIRDPPRFAQLVMVSPSPCHPNQGDYRGGLEPETLCEFIDLIDGNFLGWSAQLAPAIMGNADRPDLGQRRTDSFCRTDPDIALQFARVTSLFDNRINLPLSTTLSLILQSVEDVSAPEAVVDYLDAHLPQSRLIHLKVTEHLPLGQIPVRGDRGHRDLSRPTTTLRAHPPA